MLCDVWTETLFFFFWAEKDLFSLLALKLKNLKGPASFSSSPFFYRASTFSLNRKNVFFFQVWCIIILFKVCLRWTTIIAWSFFFLSREKAPPCKNFPPTNAFFIANFWTHLRSPLKKEQRKKKVTNMVKTYTLIKWQVLVYNMKKRETNENWLLVYGVWILLIIEE